MKLVNHLKSELYCADFKTIAVAIVMHLALGILSCVIGGSAEIYRYLLLPHFSPSPFIFIVIWTLVFFLLGASIGVYFSPCGCRSARSRTKALLLYALFLLWLFLWYPFFFGAKLFALALVIAALIFSTSLFVFRLFIKRCLLSAVLMIPCILWFGFSFLLNFCVLLLN